MQQCHVGSKFFLMQPQGVCMLLYASVTSAHTTDNKRLAMPHDERRELIEVEDAYALVCTG